MSKFGSLKLDSIKVLCWVIIYIFPGKVLSETAQFRLLLLSLLRELKLSVKKILYIFQTRFMEGVWSGVQYSRVEEPTWPGGGGGGGGGWCRRTGERWLVALITLTVILVTRNQTVRSQLPPSQHRSVRSPLNPRLRLRERENVESWEQWE